MKTVSAGKNWVINWLNAAPLKNVLKMLKNVLFERENECVCSYTICVVLAVIALAFSIGIGSYFVYSCWYLKEDVICVKFGTRIQTKI